MKTVTKSAQLLITLRQHYWGDDENKPAEFIASEAIKTVKAELDDLKLSREDVILIASVFYRTFNEERSISAMDVLGDLYKNPIDKLSNLDRIRKLVLKKIFEPDEKKYRRRDLESHKVELRVDRINVLDMDIKLHPKFISRLLGEKHQDPEAVETPYKDNKEYVQDWFSYVDALKEYHSGRQNGWDEDSIMEELAKLSQWERRLAIRTEKTDGTFPFQELVEDYALDGSEQAILMYMLKEELDDQPCSRSELLEFISEDKFDQYKNARYLEPESRLVKHSLIEIPMYMFFNSKGSEVRLFPDVSARILRATPKTDEERITEIIRGKDVFSLMNPNQGIEQLILPAAVKDTLETAITQCHDNVGMTLHKWGLDSGIFRKDGGENVDYKPSILMLFYGPPGTGKTFAAGAIAKALGKKLLITDISQILSCWVGESEKNVRSIFSQYDQIVRRTENPPILLLNECDQFLGTRGKAERSVDRMYNQMQNLFLEAFERFQGALIATTNLLDNIDPAFSRRFTLKLEFPLPEAEARQKLWEIHLPAALPVSDDIDTLELAREYPITGGQISVVVKNAAVEAAQNDDRRITQELLKKYAKLETETAFGVYKSKKMGF